MRGARRNSTTQDAFLAQAKKLRKEGFPGEREGEIVYVFSALRDKVLDIELPKEERERILDFGLSLVKDARILFSEDTPGALSHVRRFIEACLLVADIERPLPLPR
jgi:hypothetical protein